MANHTETMFNNATLIPVSTMDRFLLGVMGDIMQKMQALPGGSPVTLVFCILIFIFLIIVGLLHFVKHIRGNATQCDRTTKSVSTQLRV